MTRELIVDDEAREKIARVIAYAKKHPWRPLERKVLPATDPGYCAQLNSFKAVFTYAHLPDQVYRFLAVSLPEGQMPHPVAICIIANLFGFTGWDEDAANKIPDNWQLYADPEEQCIKLGQPCETLQ